jgi:hypothetical protein
MRVLETHIRLRSCIMTGAEETRRRFGDLLSKNRSGSRFTSDLGNNSSKISVQMICDAPMGKCTERKCGRYSGGFETRTASISQGTVKIFHEEMIRDFSPSVLDRLVQQFHIGTAASSVFSPRLSDCLHLFSYCPCSELQHSLVLLYFSFRIRNHGNFTRFRLAGEPPKVDFPKLYATMLLRNLVTLRNW